MARDPLHGFWTAGFEFWKLGLDASAVVTLRTAKIAQGGAAAAAEAHLMVAEKLEAALEVQLALMGGKLGSAPATQRKRLVRHYARKVRANRKRLTPR